MVQWIKSISATRNSLVKDCRAPIASHRAVESLVRCQVLSGAAFLRNINSVIHFTITG